MRTYKLIKIITLAIFVSVPSIISAQVAIGTLALEDGAIFQVDSNNKGVLLPRVELNSRTDTSTINGTEQDGLWVLNTQSAGSGNTRVSPGFYFWEDGEWIKVYNNGYSEQFFQTEYVKAEDQTTTYDLPGLDRDIVAPFTGTYQIIVVGHYAAGLIETAATVDGVGYASFSLEIDNIKVEETMVTSSSKRVGAGGAFHALAHQATIIYNVDLVEGASYNFKVRAREWQQANTENTFLSGTAGYGYFGIHTNIYNGNAGGDSEAQRAYMTITLLREF